jgi:hypothetical protein
METRYIERSKGHYNSVPQVPVRKLADQIRT